MKKNFFVVVGSLFVLLALVPACQIGLGEAVDTKAPNIEFYEYPETDATIRGAFTLGGKWSDDGVIKKLSIRLTNLSTKVYRDYIHYPADNLNDGIGCDKDSGLWYCEIDPIGEKLVDGTYEAKVEITDTYGHKSTITRTFALDNTAPILVLSRPTYGNSSSSFDSYGQEFSVEGYVGEATDKKYLNIEVYESEDAVEPLYTKKNIRVDSEFNITVAQKESADESLKSAYSTIYGADTNNGTKNLFIKVQAYDEALYYGNGGSTAPEGEAAIGNISTFFYLYNDLYDDVFSVYGAYDVYKMKSAVSSSDDEIEAVLDAAENQNTLARFSINPANNPSFIVSGKNALRLDGTDFASDNEDYHITNGSTIVVEITPGLDETPLNGDTLGVYAIECDANGVPLSGAEKVVLVPALKDAAGNVLLTDEEDVKARKESLSTSGSTYKFKTKLIYNGGDGLKLGASYLFGVFGCDKKGIEVSNLESVYGFVFISTVAPKVSITEPASSTNYIREGATVKVAGKIITEIANPQVIFSINDVEVILPSGTNVITSSIKNEKGNIESEFTYEIPSTNFTADKSEYALDVTAISGGLETTVTKTILYDTEAPSINVSNPGEGEWISSAENLIVKGTVNDNLGATEKFYYSTSETTFTENNKSNWNEVTLKGVSFSLENVISTNIKGSSAATISFVAIDKAGNVSDIVTRAINIDAEKPELSVVSIKIGEADAVDVSSVTKAQNVDTYVLSGHASDESSKVSLKITRDNLAVPVYTKEIGLADDWEFTDSGLVDGTHEYTVTATDESGKTVENKFSVQTDISIPTGAINASDGKPGIDETKNNTFTFGGTASDGENGSGIERVDLTITDLADSTITHTEKVSGTTDWNLKVQFKGSDSVWSEVFATEGWKYITVKVTDKAGNIYETPVPATDSYKFEYDNADPVLTITKGDTQQFMSSNGFSFEGTATDTYGIDKLVLIEEKYNEAENKYEETEASTARTAITITDNKWIQKVPMGDVELSDGKYQFKFELTDTAGHKVSSQSFETIVDSVAPEVTINTVSGYQKNSLYTFTGKIVEANLDVATATVYRVKKDTETEDVTISEKVIVKNNLDEEGNWSWRVTDMTDDGEYYLVVTAEDLAGTITSETSGILTIDTTVPVIEEITLGSGEKLYDSTGTEITSLADGNTYYAKEDFSISGKITELNYDNTKVTLTINDDRTLPAGVTKPVLSADTNAATGTTDSYGWNFVRVADEGTYKYHLKAEDKAGNTSTFTITVCYDTTAPVLSIVYPTDGSAINMPTVSANGSVTETGIGIKSLEYSTNAADANPTWTALNYSGGNSWNQNLSLSDEGAVTLSLRAVDKLGNHSSTDSFKAVSFNYDKAAPAITVNSVAQYQNGGDDGIVTLNGSAYDSNGISKIEINDTSANKKYVYDFTADEKAAGRTYARDLDNERTPTVTVPSWSFVFKVGSTNSDDSMYLGEGTHDLSIVLTDVADRTSEKSVSFIVDTVAPVVATPLPAPGTDETEKTTYKFIGQADDATTQVREVQIAFADPDAVDSIANVKTASGTTTWTYNSTFADEKNSDESLVFGTSGQKTIYVRAKDSAGNWSSWLSQAFDYDTEAPAVTIDNYFETSTASPETEDSPASYSYPATGNDASNLSIGTSKVFKISGTIEDDWGFAAAPMKLVQKRTVNKAITTIELTTVAEINTTDGTWSLSGLPRNPSDRSKTLTGTDLTGDYEYEITVTDKAGKQSSKILKCVIDVAPPEVSISTPSANLEKAKYISDSTYSFYGKANDVGSAGVDRMYYKFVRVDGDVTPNQTQIDAVAWTEEAASNGNWSIDKDIIEGTTADAEGIKLYEGKWFFYFKAKDASNNMSSVVSRYFWIDRAAPVVSETSIPSTGLTTNTTVALSGSASDTNKLTSVIITDSANTDFSKTVIPDSTGAWTTSIALGSGDNTKLADGTHTLKITATDIVGRKTVIDKTVVADTSAPVVNDDSNLKLPSGSDFDNAITFSGTASDASPSSGFNSVKVQFADASSLAAATNKTSEITVAGTSSWNYEIAKNDFYTDGDAALQKVFGTNEGIKYIFIKATDNAGNISDVVTKSFIYDRSAPSVTVFNYKAGDAAAENITNENNSFVSKHNTFTISGDFADTCSNVEIIITRNGYDAGGSLVVKNSEGTVVTNGSVKSGTWTYTESSVVDGTQSYIVKTKDASGRVVSKNLTVLVDTTAPAIGTPAFATSPLYLDVSTYDTLTSSVTDPKGTDVDAISDLANVYYQITTSSTAPAANAGTWVEMNRARGTNWTSTINLGEKKDGTYYTFVKATDDAGNTTITQTGVSLLIDEKRPVLSVINGKTNAGSETVEFNVRVTDTNPVAPTAVTVTVPSGGQNVTGTIVTPGKYYKADGTEIAAANVASSTEIAYAEWKVSIPLTANIVGGVDQVKDGLYTIKLEGKDAVNREAIAITHTIARDTTPPSVEIKAPATGEKASTGKSAISNKGFQFSGTAGDGANGSGVNTVWYQILGSTVTAPTVPAGDKLVEANWTGWTKASGSLTSWNFYKETDGSSGNLNQGKYKVYVCAVDNAGNISNLNSVYFEVDWADPSIEVQTKKNGGSFAALANSETQIAAYGFRFKVEDSFGINSTAYGTSPNQIPYSLVVKKDGTVVDASKVTVTAETSGSPAVATGWYIVTIGNESYVDGGETKYRQADGSYVYTIKTKDLVGKETEESRTIKLDTKGPEISISSPEFDAATNKSKDWVTSSKVRIAGNSDDESKVNATYWKLGTATAPTTAVKTDSSWTTLGWKKIADGSASWSFEIDSGLVDGNNTISLASVDEHGNSTGVKTFTLKYDNTNPTLAVTNASSITTNTTFTLSGTVYDSTNGVASVKISDGTKVYSTSATEETLAGAVADGSKADWSKTFTITTGRENGAKDGELSDGSYTFTITAVDVAGREKTSEVRVLIDTKAPVISSQSVDLSSATAYVNDTTAFDYRTIGEGDSAVNWFRTNVIPVKAVSSALATEAAISKVEYTTTRTGAGTAADPYVYGVWAPLTSGSDNTYTGNVSVGSEGKIYVKATDAAGNVSAVSAISVNVDTTAPASQTVYSAVDGITSISGQQKIFTNNIKGYVSRPYYFVVKTEDAGAGIDTVKVSSINGEAKAIAGTQLYYWKKAGATEADDKYVFTTVATPGNSDKVYTTVTGKNFQINENAISAYDNTAKTITVGGKAYTYDEAKNNGYYWKNGTGTSATYMFTETAAPVAGADKAYEQVESSSAVSSYTYSADNKTVTVGSDIYTYLEERYLITLNLADRKDGVVKVTVTDMVGNAKEFDNVLSLSIDEKAPTIDLSKLQIVDTGTGTKLDFNSINGIVNMSGTAYDDNGLTGVKLYYREKDASGPETDAAGTKYKWTLVDPDGSNAGTFNWSRNNTYSEAFTNSGFKLPNGIPFYIDYDADTSTPGVQQVLRMEATDTAGNITNVYQAVTIDQNADRPVIRLTSIASNGTTTLTSKRINGSIVDDDGNVLKMWYAPVATAETVMPTSPSFENNTWTVPSGWIEVDELSSNSFAIESKKAADTKADDGDIFWYFAIADANKSVFTTKNTSDTLQETKILFSDSGSTEVSNSSIVKFKFDTTAPRITEFKVFKAKNSDLIASAQATVTGEGQSQVRSVPTAAKIEEYIKDKAATGAVWTNEKNTAFGKDYSNLYAKVVVYEATAMDGTTPIKLAFNGTDFTLTGKTSVTSDGAGNYTYILGPFDMSTDDAEGSLSADLKAYVYDAVGNDRDEALTIIRDNAEPTSISSVKPENTEIVYGALTLRGSVSDNTNGSGILYKQTTVDGVTTIESGIQYYMPVAGEVAGTTSAVTDAKAIAANKWKTPNTVGSGTWEIDIADMSTTIGGYLGTSYVANTNYSNFEYKNNGASTGLYKIPVWFRLTDSVGNVGYNVDTYIFYNPDTDRPTVGISYPVEDTTTNGISHISMGGNVLISGSANDDDGLTGVYLQFDFDCDGKWDNGIRGLSDAQAETGVAKADNTAWITGVPDSIKSSVVKIPAKVGGSDAYGIKVSGTKSWNYTLNVGNLGALNVADNKTLKVRAISVEKDDGKNAASLLSSSWSDTLHISVNNLAPSFSNLKVKQFASAPAAYTTSSTAELDYSENMYLKGDWYLTGTITANTEISSVSVTEDKTLSYSNAEGAVNTLLCSLSTDKKTLDFIIPFDKSKDLSQLKVYVEDSNSPKQHAEREFKVQPDNTAPNFVDTVSGVTDGIKLYKNGYGTSGTELNATSSDNYIQNSNGANFTLAGKVNEAGSGYDKVVFYFKRTTSAGGSPRVYNPMEAYGTKSGSPAKYANQTNIDSKADGNVYINDDKLPVLYLAATSVTRGDTDKLSFSSSAENKNIRIGGLVKLAGVYRTITGVSFASGTMTVDFTPSCATSFKEAEFVYGLVIDNSGESEATNAQTGNTYIKGDDGDGMIESFTKSGTSYTWDATINSQNIPDGPIEIHAVAFDKAGNTSHGVTSTRVSNNPPRITKVMLGTDLNGNGKYDTASEFETFYAVKNNSGDGDTTKGKEVWNLDTKTELGGASYFTAKKDLVVIPEFVGGTAPYYYKFDKSVGTSADTIQGATKLAAAATGATTAFTALATSNANLMTGAAVASLNSLKASANSNGVIVLTTDTTDSNTTVGNTSDLGEDKVNVYSFSFWDSTEESTYGNNTQWTVLNAVIKQDLVDATKPAVVIKPFHWYGKGSSTSKTYDEVQSFLYSDVKGNNGYKNVTFYTDSDCTAEVSSSTALTATVYAKVSVPINSLYNPEEGTANGHIELSEDWINGASGYTNAANGIGDGDSKVSGKITVRGTAYDNVQIKEIGFTFGDATNTGSAFVSQTAAELNSSTKVLESKATGDLNGTNKWKFTIDKQTSNQFGHLVEWSLSIDTSLIAKVAATDIVLNVYAVDSSDNNTEKVTVSGTEVAGRTASDTVGNETHHKPTLQMDVVPYVTSVSTNLDSLNASNPSVYSRTALGHYPVYISTEYKGNSTSTLTYEDTVETVKIKGFNLSGVKYGTNNLSVTNGIVSLPVNLLSKSGDITLEVNGISTINNLNDNNSKGTVTEDTSTFVGYYNRQPNGINNNLLTDDLAFDVWEINTRAASPLSGTVQQPVMKINPGNGMLGFAFVNGAMSFSMPSGTPNSSGWYDIVSHDTMNGSGDFFTSVGFNYDKLGYSYGVAAGGDIDVGSNVCDPLAFMSSRWGKGDLQTSVCKWGNGYFSKLENIGQVDGDGNKIFQKPRFMSPSIATAVHGSTTNVYLAYYDDMNAEIRFRAGSLSGTGSAYKDTKVTSRSDFGDFVDQYGGNDHRAPEVYKITNCNLLAGHTSGYDTGYTAGEYVSVGVVSAEGSSYDDVVVVVWYDSTNMQLYYTYNEIHNNAKTGINVTKAKYTYGANGQGFETPSVIHSGSAEYCKLAVDKQGGIHVAYCDSINGDVYYAYAPSYSSNFTTYLVDSYMMGGAELSLDVALDANNNPIPYISYYGNSVAHPKIAYLVDASNLDKGADNDMYTQKWEVSIVPTTSIVVEDHFSVGAWKNSSGKLEAPTTTYASITYKYLKSGTSKSGYVYSDRNTSTKTGYPSRYFDYRNDGVLVNSGNCGQVFGNGTSNPVVGYRNKVGTKGYIETAQMK